MRNVLTKNKDVVILNSYRFKKELSLLESAVFWGDFSSVIEDGATGNVLRWETMAKGEINTSQPHLVSDPIQKATIETDYIRTEGSIFRPLFNTNIFTLSGTSDYQGAFDVFCVYQSFTTNDAARSHGFGVPAATCHMSAEPSLRFDGDAITNYINPTAISGNVIGQFGIRETIKEDGLNVFTEYGNGLLSLDNQSASAAEIFEDYFSIGSVGSSAGSYVHYFKEIIIYNRKLNTSERTEITNYLKNKYSIV